MNCVPKLPKSLSDRGSEVLIGRSVASASVPGKSDLSDWVDLMEVVEALCPVWPAQVVVGEGGVYKL